MADQADKTAPGTDSPDSNIVFDNEMGDDWGEVFAAEDDMFSPEDDASESFFLDEDGTEAGSPSLATELVSPGAEAAGMSAPGQARPVSFAARLLSLGKLYKDKFQSFSLLIRIAAGVVGAGILLALVLNIYPGGKTPNPKLTNPPPPTAGSKLAGEPSPNLNKAAASPPGGHEMVVQTPPKPLPIKTSPEKIDKKWPLPSFFIAVTGEHGKKTAILTVDLTLFLLLPKDKLPPAKHEILTRDIIFQFFNNQPLSEIQRYSLARGDMKRKLRAWIAKQLPNLPLSAIVFDRYQIL
ncbi:MAG: hypothetical protein GXP59_02910 [Deltaproteobacteria bacterium]|nr:hypothetical protein [Deltaproteobacteria bacterium]